MGESVREPFSAPLFWGLRWAWKILGAPNGVWGAWPQKPGDTSMCRSGNTCGLPLAAAWSVPWAELAALQGLLGQRWLGQLGAGVG